jgi:hypothetical protein
MFTDGQLAIIRKPFFKLKELIAAYMKDYADYGKSSPFIVHFRYATHGGKTEENTHPHMLDCGVGMVHNGILDGFDPPWKTDYSDTVHFCRTVLAYRNANDLVGDTMRTILERMIGNFNKFVLLHPDGRVSIINESAGQWDGSVWYSNAGYKQSIVRTACKGGNVKCGGNDDAGRKMYEDYKNWKYWTGKGGTTTWGTCNGPSLFEDDDDSSWASEVERYAALKELEADGRWNDPNIPDRELSDEDLQKRERLQELLQADMMMNEEYDRRVG